MRYSNREKRNKMKYIKMKDFQKELDQEAYEDIYQELVQRSIDLAKALMKLKKIDFPKEDEDILYTIEYTFKSEFGQFREMIYLMRNLTLWDCANDFFCDTKEQKLEALFRQYNSLIYELKQYQSVQKELKEKDYFTLIEERIEKLRKLFMEMLDYKKKPYPKDADFDSLLPLVARYYNIYSASLYDAQSAISCHLVSFDIEEDSVLVNDVEAIMFLDDLYNELTCEGDDYKEYANYYRDFDLKEGETYEDLYQQEEVKFAQLFREMLDFVGAAYDPKEDVNRLRLQVVEHYPYYSNLLLNFYSHNPNDTYVQILDDLENKYESIKEHYQDREEHMRRYEEEEKRRREEVEEDDDFFDSDSY